MKKSTRSSHTLEFKREAVRMVENGQTMAAAGRSLGVVEQTLFNWVMGASILADEACLSVLQCVQVWQSKSQRFKSPRGDSTGYRQSSLTLIFSIEQNT